MECKKKLGNGTWTVLPADQCDEKPSSQLPCNEMPCYKWRVQYPCVSCGGKVLLFVLLEEKEEEEEMERWKRILLTKNQK